MIQKRRTLHRFYTLHNYTEKYATNIKICDNINTQSVSIKHSKVYTHKCTTARTIMMCECVMLALHQGQSMWARIRERLVFFGMFTL